MLKILTTEQIRAVDAATVATEGIPSIALMERACHAFANWFIAKFDTTKKIGIICGTGNNGGDGLGIARILSEHSYAVTVWIVPGKESDDFKANRLRFPSALVYDSHRPFTGCDILIDAIFGSGLSRPADGLFRTAIETINNYQAIKIAVDIPSGLLADRPSSGVIVKADHTVSFQLPKLAFMLPENHKYVGSWTFIDIGLNQSAIDESASSRFFLTKDSVKQLLKARSKFDHKGDHGKALLIAGSLGKMGAAILSAKACLRAGVGLLTVHVPTSGYQIMQTSVPEAMVSIDSNEETFSVFPKMQVCDVIGIGPGLGKSSDTVRAFRKTLEAAKPMVIDADALNILSEHNELLHIIPSGSILTPHPKEFERLAGEGKNDFERLSLLTEFARRINAIVILKGAHTAIASPDGNVYFNSTGNPGMATGGTGDTLTGILTGLLAQKYDAKEAAILGVYLHGLSGDLAAADKSQFSLIASDIIDFLPAAYISLS